MTTEIWRVHILWIFQITKITRAKLPIQNCLSGGFQERVGIKVIIPQSIYFYFKSTDFIVFIHILCIILFFEVIPFLNQK